MNESFESASAPAPERPPIYQLKDRSKPWVLGQIRVDVDGNLWECVQAPHNVARELEIQASGDRFWEEKLQTVSDDAQAAMDNLHREDDEKAQSSIFGDPALTWRPVQGPRPDATYQ